ncbi:MAG: pitrilysin family protein, partial [Candidatus Wallbacteria bacterium]|nr:pitrilysin family protein [Candidatus Wallbacteria bacterium]
KEYTCFYARVVSKHLELALDILCDIVFNPLFQNSDFEREKNVILEEIKMYEDTPDEIIHDMLPNHIFDHTALKLPILGTPESLAGIGNRNMREFYDENYHPGNVIFTFGGKVDALRAEQLVMEKTIFSGVKNHSTSITKSGKDQVGFLNGYLHRDKEIEQCHLLIGFPGIAHLDDRLYQFNMLNNILAGSMSSRIFQKVREELGQAYSTFSYLLSYMNTGLFAIYAACDPKNLQTVNETIWSEIETLIKNGVTEKELEISKNQYISSLFLSLESTYNRMLRLAKYEFYYNRNVGIDEVVGKVEKISCGQVTELAGEFLKRQASYTVTLGKKDGGLH